VSNIRKEEVKSDWGTLVRRFNVENGIIRIWICIEINVLDSVALVRKRTIPIERPLLVGEVSANFCV
jgi:hypothetical protein